MRIIEWSGLDDNWVKGSHPYAFEINNKILEKKRIVQDLIKKSYNFNKRLTFETIFEHLKRKGDINSFYAFMQRYIDNPPEKLEDNTIKKYKTTLIHLKKFRKELFFADIDNIFLTDFLKFMRTTLSLEGAAAKKYLQTLKKVIRQARKENYLEPSQMEFLFDGLKVKVPKAKRTYLEPTEIKAWKNYLFPESRKALERDRDLFLFQIYTGFYYKDFFIFTKDQLIDDEQYGYFILGARDKNGNQTIIPLYKFSHAGVIIKKYRSAVNDKEVFNSVYFNEEQVYNRNLKEIASMVGISKNLTNKVARHTNAQLWVRYGAERPVLSKMLGHENESTTKSYYDINIPEIIEGVKQVDFKRLGI